MKKTLLTAILLLATIFIIGQSDPFVSKTPVQTTKEKCRSLSLPFIEDWSSSSFDTNNWTTECENWVINSLEGNDRPSVEFDWLPQLQNDYSCILTSDFFNGDLVEVGQIILEFEIRLDDRSSTGDEKLLVEVFDGNQWNQVVEFANEGNMAWTFKYIDITNYALGNLFQIRFHAVGQNSYDILSWFVDNIEVYRVCEAPSELDGHFFWDVDDQLGIEVFWEAPENTVNEEFNWINWDNGIDGSIGFNPLSNYSVASRWDADQLTEFVGDTIYSIRLYLYNDQFEDAIIRVWKGENAEELIYTDTIVTPILNKWMEYLMDSIIVLEGSEEYWVGYSIIEQFPYTYPVGIDAGPAVKGYGDLIYTEDGGWDSISNFGMDYNFNIQMRLQNSDTDTSDCIGFNIYRMALGDIEYNLLGYQTIDLNHVEQHFLDYDVENEWWWDVCYQVSAVWSNNDDMCESDFALNVVGIDDFVCVTYSGDSEEEHYLDVKLFPNPANNIVYLQSEIQIKEVSLLNFQGQILYHQRLNIQTQLEFDVSFLQPGIYFIKVKTDQGVGIKKFMKME